ncbi:MAG TPA: hypothetical protein VIM56_05180 [Rhizomicrobium sp.]
MNGGKLSAGMISLCALSHFASPAWAQANSLETVVVGGNAPLGGQIDPDKVAGEIQTISVSLRPCTESLDCTFA